MFYCQVVAEEVAGGSDEVFLQFRAEKLDKKVGDMVLRDETAGVQNHPL